MVVLGQEWWPITHPASLHLFLSLSLDTLKASSDAVELEADKIMATIKHKSMESAQLIPMVKITIALLPCV